MKTLHLIHSQPPPHRPYLTSLPLIYSPQTKTPLLLRFRAAAWRMLFTACRTGRPSKR